MSWKYFKDKILVFGEDDYLFADMFISILSAYESSKIEDLKVNTYTMLQELMKENLIDVFLLEYSMHLNKQVLNNILYNYKTKEDIENFIRKIDKEWALLDYQMPGPDKLFWITTTEKGKRLIQLSDGKY